MILIPKANHSSIVQRKRRIVKNSKSKMKMMISDRINYIKRKIKDTVML